MKNYEVIRYPDNQISVKVLSFPAFITFRVASYEDLFILKSIVDVYRYYGHSLSTLTIPCLFGQRSDMRFSENQSFDLKNICEFINSLNIPRVKVFDAHSNVSTGILNNCERIGPDYYVQKALQEIKAFCYLVSPDAGAYKKVFKYSENFNLPVVAANKFRDLDGNITLNIMGNVDGQNCLIVDDLLDGGYTFHLLAEKLKEQGAKKVYLYISHAYFNKGVDFTPHIDHFYCTDSVKEIIDPKVTQFKFIH